MFCLIVPVVLGEGGMLVRAVAFALIVLSQVFPAAAQSSGGDPLSVLRSSQITKYHKGFTTSDQNVPPIQTAGLRRGEFVYQIYMERWSWVANHSTSDFNYHIRTLANIQTQCPDLRIRDRIWELAPYIFAVGERNFLTGWKRDSSTPLETGEILGRAIQTYAMISPEADQDVPRLLLSHPCNSPVLARYVDNLFRFAQIARARPFVKGQMPAPDTPKGKSLIRIFDNCTQQAENGWADAWCGCYVRTLVDTKASDEVLALMEKNPFVDGRTYMEAVGRSTGQYGKLYECATPSNEFADYARARREKVTACLVSQNPCLYRSSWADFTIGGNTCLPVLTSHYFGGQEISCEPGKIAAVQPSQGPKRYKDGVYTKIDYEEKVAGGFVPPVPDTSRNDMPLMIRLLKQEQSGSVFLIQIVKAHIAYFDEMFRLKQGSPDWNAAADAILAVSRDGAIIECSYVGTFAGGRVTRASAYQRYWYKAVPPSLASINLNQRLGGHPHPLTAIRPARSDCPASPQ